MDGATLNSKIYAGYAKAARALGTSYQHYRASGAANPLAAGNLLGSLPLSLNAEDPRYLKPNTYGHALWYAVADGAQLRVGDYVVGNQGTLFVAATQALLPIVLVECPRVVTILRPQQQAGVGALGYGGDTDAGEVALLGNWPASILQSGGGEKPHADLPGDVKAAGWQVLLPALPGVVVQNADLITDDLGRRYAIVSAELSSLGWRLDATQVET